MSLTRVTQLLSSPAGDVIYTIGLLISADAFPKKMQGLAGAVFNVFYMLGSSIGLTIVDVIMATVDQPRSELGNPSTRMPAFRASFWTLFGAAVASAVLGAYGLRALGRIGTKSENGSSSDA